MRIEASPVIRLAVSAMTPLVIVVGVYLLLAGHNRPGGGFAAGLLLGAGVVIRDAARLPRPKLAGPWLSIGGLICVLTAVLPMFWGDAVLDQVVIEEPVTGFGKLKTGTALVFDIGVVAIVIGLIVATLGGFTKKRFDAAIAADEALEGAAAEALAAEAAADEASAEEGEQR